MNTEPADLWNLSEGDRILWDDRKRPMEVVETREDGRMVEVEAQRTTYTLYANTKGYKYMQSDKPAYYHSDDGTRRTYVDDLRRVVEDDE